MRSNTWSGVRVNHRVLGCVLTFAVAVTGAGPSAAHAQMPAPKLTPEKLEMGAFYDGARIRIQGTAPKDVGIVAVVRGGGKDEFFNRKGRVGIIWLNTDRIHIKRAPSVFVTFSSDNANSLLDRESLDEYQLDEVAIKKQIQCLRHCKCKLSGGDEQQSGSQDAQPDPSYAELIRRDFLGLKEHEGSYCVRPNSITLASLPDAAIGYTLEFPWPRNALPGSYRVEVYACRDHKVIAQSMTTLQVAVVGFPAFMAKLAAQRPWIYGTAAVLIAMFAGFGTDAVTVRLRRRKRGTRSGSVPPPPPRAGPGQVTADSCETETADSCLLETDHE